MPGMKVRVGAAVPGMKVWGWGCSARHEGLGRAAVPGMKVRVGAAVPGMKVGGGAAVPGMKVEGWGLQCQV